MFTKLLAVAALCLSGPAAKAPAAKAACGCCCCPAGCVCNQDCGCACCKAGCAGCCDAHKAK